MSFALLAPLALGLLALAAGPVLAHLARRKPNKDQPYGAMLLLRRVSRKLRKRRRLRDLLLMLLRVLAVALVAMAASQPEVRSPGGAPEIGGTGAVVIVLDNSLSMDLQGAGVLTAADASSPDALDDPDARPDGTLLSIAREQAVALVRSLPEGTLVGAVVIGGEAVRLTPTMTRERGVVAAALEGVTQSQGGTDLVGGLRLARRLLGGSGGEVVVYSDEAGPVAVPAAREEIVLLGQQGAALVPRPLRARSPSNLAVVDARYGDGPEGGTVAFRIANYGDDDVEVPVVVALPDGTEITAFAEVPAGGIAEDSVTVPRVAEGGVALARIEAGDLSDVAADNEFAFHLPRVGASRVLVVDGDPGLTPTASEVYFLERALAPWGMAAAAASGVMPDVISASGVSELDPAVHRVVFVANLGDPAQLSTRLLEFVRAGGGLVIGLGDNVTANRYNNTLSALLPASLKRPRALTDPDEPGVATEIPDTELSLFRPFARGGRTSFPSVRWQTLFTLDPYEDTVLGSDAAASDRLPEGAVRTLLRLQGGLPLIVERAVGRGRVLLFTGTFDLGWGNMPLQSVYMPFVQRLVTYLGGEAGGGGERRSARVGQSVSVPLPDSALDVSVSGPRGPVAAHVDSGSVLFTPQTAGAYLVETPGAPPLAWVAVNVDPSESDVRRGPSLVETAADVDPDRYLLRYAVAPWLLLAGLGIVLVQAVASAAGGRAAQGEDGERMEEADEQ